MRPMRQDWYSRSSFSPWLVQQKSIWRLSRGLMRHWIRARSRFSRDRMTRDIWAGRMPSSFWISPTIIVPFDWSSDSVRNSTSLSSPPRRRPRRVDRQIWVTSWNSSCATSSSRCPVPVAIVVVVPSLVPRDLDGAGGDRGGKERDRSAASLTYSMINVDTTLSIAKGQRLRKRNGLRPNGWDMPAVRAWRATYFEAAPIFWPVVAGLPGPAAGSGVPGRAAPAGAASGGPCVVFGGPRPVACPVVFIGFTAPAP